MPGKLKVSITLGSGTFAVEMNLSMIYDGPVGEEFSDCGYLSPSDECIAIVEEVKISLRLRYYGFWSRVSYCEGCGELDLVDEEEFSRGWEVVFDKSMVLTLSSTVVIE